MKKIEVYDHYDFHQLVHGHVGVTGEWIVYDKVRDEVKGCFDTLLDVARYVKDTYHEGTVDVGLVTLWASVELEDGKVIKIESEHSEQERSIAVDWIYDGDAPSQDDGHYSKEDVYGKDGLV